MKFNNQNVARTSCTVEQLRLELAAVVCWWSLGHSAAAVCGQSVTTDQQWPLLRLHARMASNQQSINQRGRVRAFVAHWSAAGADLRSGHLCSGRRGPCHMGLGGPWWKSIKKLALQLPKLYNSIIESASKVAEIFWMTTVEKPRKHLLLSSQ